MLLFSTSLIDPSAMEISVSTATDVTEAIRRSIEGDISLRAILNAVAMVDQNRTARPAYIYDLVLSFTPDIFRGLYFIISKPVKGTRTAGIFIPSGVWLFSRSAATILGRARALPFSV